MFAENQRISHRQLYRQVILTLMSPFLLALPGWQNLWGMNGVVGILANLAIYVGFVIFLVRLSPAYEHLTKYTGKTVGLIIGILYGIFLVFTGAYVLNMAASMTGTYLITGLPGWLISLLLATVCVTGTHMGMEKRGRMGEVSYVIVFGALLLLILLSIFQKEPFGAAQFWKENFSVNRAGMALWGSFCAFLPVTLLPFILSGVSRQGSAGKVLYGSIATLSGVLLVLMYLLPVTLGWERMLSEEAPMLPYMAGTNLPGDVLARFDVIWVGVFLYGLLFSLGSVFYYCSHIFHKIQCPVPHFIWGILVYVISMVKPYGMGIQEYYPVLFTRLLAPVLLVLPVWVYVMFRRKRKS